MHHLLYLPVFPAELVFQCDECILHQFLQGGILTAQAAAHQMGHGGTGKKGQRTAIGQGHTLGAQTVQLLLPDVGGVGKKPHGHGGGNAGRVVIAVPGCLHRAPVVPAQPAALQRPVQGLNHPGVGAVATAQFGHPEDPAQIPGGLVIAALADGPLLLGNFHIADQWRHGAPDLPPGLTDEQAVAGKGGQLGMGGDVGIAVAQIEAHQTVGTVVLFDLGPGFGIDGVSHGIADGKAHETAPDGRALRDHLSPHLYKNSHFIIPIPEIKGKKNVRFSGT